MEKQLPKKDEEFEDKLRERIRKEKLTEIAGELAPLRLSKDSIIAISKEWQVAALRGSAVKDLKRMISLSKEAYKWDCVELTANGLGNKANDRITVINEFIVPKNVLVYSVAAPLLGHVHIVEAAVVGDKKAIQILKDAEEGKKLGQYIHNPGMTVDCLVRTNWEAVTNEGMMGLTDAYYWRVDNLEREKKLETRFVLHLHSEFENPIPGQASPEDVYMILSRDKKADWIGIVTAEQDSDFGFNFGFMVSNLYPYYVPPKDRQMWIKRMKEVSPLRNEEGEKGQPYIKAFVDFSSQTEIPNYGTKVRSLMTYEELLKEVG
jgi:hypothetical protein